MKRLALLFAGGKVQSEILRAVYPERAERDPSPAGRDQDDSEGLRMTAGQTSARNRLALEVIGRGH